MIRISRDLRDNGKRPLSLAVSHRAGEASLTSTSNDDDDDSELDDEEDRDGAAIL